MFVTTAFVANVVVRDDETGYGPIIRATRIRKAEYLYGRFLGAFLAACLAFIAIPLGTLIGSFAPWVDPEKIGPFRPGDYLYTYFVLALPGLLVVSAGFFALATATRSMMATYIGVVAILVLYTVVTAVTDKPQYLAASAYLEYLAASAYLDPFGLGAVSLATRYWAPAQRNAQLVPLLGPLLWNRVLWLTIAGGLLALAYGLYRPGARPRRSPALKPEPPPPALASPPRILARPVFGAATQWAQLLARTRLDFAQVFLSPALFILLALGVFNAGVVLWLSDGGYGVKVYPVTRLMITVLEGAFTLIPVIVAIYYSGELVWRERDRRTEEIIDAAPIPDWMFVGPKIAAIALVFAALMAVSVLVGVGVQILKGFHDFELLKYAAWYFAPLCFSLTLFATLCVFVQAVSPHKFIGWAVMMGFIIAQIVLSSLGFEHNLYRFGGGLIGPLVPLSDLNGLGRPGLEALWLRAYWGAVSLGLAVLAYGLWRRGTETRLSPRLRRLPRRLAGPAGAVLAVSILAAAGLGGFIFVNTNIWNPYHTSIDDERWAADYEKAFLKFEATPQPTITSVTLKIDLRPKAPSAVTDGVYVIQNTTAKPIDTVHVRFAQNLKVLSLSVEGARLNADYARFNYRIYAYDSPLLPGERRRIVFRTRLAQKGFANSRNLTDILDNGTFLDNTSITPMIGMDRDFLLSDRSKRRKYGLPPELRMPRLEDLAAQRFSVLRRDSNWVTADITVATESDQTPIAPGYKVSDVTAGGRRTARFVTEAPINHFFSIQSARYALARTPYKGVDLAVYYHPGHAWNVERMTKALEAGLDLYQTIFSPYQFRQVRIVEFPAPRGAFAQSFANTIPYSEDLGFIYDARDPDQIDMATYITAHELGHQWWAHQVIGANMQGATMLDETLAQYSALSTMEALYGRDQIRKFLKFELDAYLRGRGSEALEEEPLYRVENQGYVHYRKGSLVMYRLKDVIGAKPVNLALRRFLKAYAFKGPPYPRSTDLISLLREEAGPDPMRQNLITDLFEKAVRAASHRRADGRYDVSVAISAKKYYADGKGRETATPMSEPVDVGLFAKEPGSKGFAAKDVLAMRRVTLTSGNTTVNFVSDAAPAVGGVDPYNTMINRNSDQNLVRVAH